MKIVDSTYIIREFLSFSSTLYHKCVPKIDYNEFCSHKDKINEACDRITTGISEFDEYFFKVRDNHSSLCNTYNTLKKEYDQIKKKEDFYCTFMKNSQQNIFTNSNNNSRINSYKNLRQFESLEQKQDDEFINEMQSIRNSMKNGQSNILKQTHNLQKQQMINIKKLYDKYKITQANVNNISNDSIDQNNLTHPTIIYSDFRTNLEMSNNSGSSIPSKFANDISRINNDVDANMSIDPIISNKMLENDYKDINPANSVKIDQIQDIDQYNKFMDQNPNLEEFKNMSNSYRQFPKDNGDDDNNYVWLKMPEEINFGKWDPQFDSEDSQDNTELYKMNSMERCKFLNERILNGAMKKCKSIVDKNENFYNSEDDVLQLNDLNNNLTVDPKQRIFIKSQSLRRMSMSKRSFSEDQMVKDKKPDFDRYNSMKSLKNSRNNTKFRMKIDSIRNDQVKTNQFTKTILLDLVKDKNNDLQKEERELLLFNLLMNNEQNNKKEVNLQNLNDVKEPSFMQMDVNINGSLILTKENRANLLNSILDDKNLHNLSMLSRNNASLRQDSLVHVKLEDILMEDSFEDNDQYQTSDIAEEESYYPQEKDSICSSITDERVDELDILNKKKYIMSTGDYETTSSMGYNNYNTNNPKLKSKNQSKIPKYIKPKKLETKNK